MITDKDDVVAGDSTISNGKVLVPGDVVYYSGSEFYHVMIIQRITYDEIGNIDLENIKLIEATFDTGELKMWGNIKNENSLQDKQHNEWLLGRIRNEKN